MSESGFGNPEIVEEEVDLLIIGGGMAACGAAFEITRWVEKAKTKGIDLKVKLVDKAAIDRSGAVAQGLSAINTYMGENDPADYVRYVRGDLMGITREDLVYDVGRHVDDSVHNFEKWGLPIWKQKGDEGKSLVDGGKCVRTGKWQIMINGESYKWIVAEAAKNAIGTENIQEHVFIVRLETDKNDANRVAGAVGFPPNVVELVGHLGSSVCILEGPRVPTDQRHDRDMVGIIHDQLAGWCDSLAQVHSSESRPEESVRAAKPIGVLRMC